MVDIGCTDRLRTLGIDLLAESSAITVALSQDPCGEVGSTDDAATAQLLTRLHALAEELAAQGKTVTS